MLAEYLRATGCTRLLVCTGGFEDIPEGFLAGRWARVPVVAYFFDWYGMQWPTRLRRMVALWIESRIIRQFDAVIVPNEALRDALVARYGVQPVVIHNPCHEHALSQRAHPTWPTADGEITVVYTGAVYHAHFDAFRNLVLALAGSAPASMRLHVYTSQPPTVLGDQGIEAGFVFHGHLPPDSIAEVQRRADVLFLPLAFESPIDEVLRTSAPGKMGDYLATGRPILVHAPPGSFLSRYFREHGCGVVVDNNSPIAVAGALERIAGDASLRQVIGEKARERAQIDFDPALARATFRHVVDRHEVP
jgi:glycosyltransferase involved in cell wall biosynthesis